MAPVAAPLMGWRNNRLQSVLAQASQIIAPTEFVRQIYAGLGVDTAQMTVVRHGIELPAEAIASARRKRSARSPGLPLHIGYIGSIGWQKGVHVLIAAVNALPDDQVRLTIYGGLDNFPGYVSQLRGLIKHPRIRLAGPVSREELWMALAEFDLLVMPTLWYEVSPLTIDEVFALGIPIVASNIGAMSEKINDDINGRLVPPGDAAALAKTLADIIANPDLLAKWQLGINPVRTIENHVREIEELYQSTLNTV
jgi:glycosyltransferase involved in cell wall biosynthesis